MYGKDDLPEHHIGHIKIQQPDPHRHGGPLMLIVDESHVKPRMRRNRILKNVIKDVCEGGMSTHSDRAATLPLIINELERRRVPYTLHAEPGVGYTIRGYPHD